MTVLANAASNVNRKICIVDLIGLSRLVIQKDGNHGPFEPGAAVLTRNRHCKPVSWAKTDITV